MSKTSVARRYATPACELAEAEDRLDEFVDELREVVGAMEPYRDRLFHNPAVSTDKKRQLLEQTVGEDGDNLIASLLHLLLRKNRLNVLPELTEACQEEADRRQNRKEVTVQTAYTLDDDQNRQLTDVLESVVGADVRLSEELNETLLAGLRLTIDDYRIDYSVQNQLEQLRRRFT